MYNVSKYQEVRRCFLDSLPLPTPSPLCFIIFVTDMSVEVETRSRTRFFRRGVRRLLSTNGSQRSSDVAALASTPAAAPVQAMFQDARNTNIRRATFNICMYVIFQPSSLTSNCHNNLRWFRSFYRRSLVFGLNDSSAIHIGPIDRGDLSSHEFDGYKRWLCSPTRSYPNTTH